MAWPLPSLPDPIRAATTTRGQANAAPSPQQPNTQDPLTTLWMLANQPRAQAVTPPAQGLGAAYQLADAGTAQSKVGDYNQPSAAPTSAAASPFDALSDTYRHEALASRFPWMSS